MKIDIIPPAFVKKTRNKLLSLKTVQLRHRGIMERKDSAGAL